MHDGGVGKVTYRGLDEVYCAQRELEEMQIMVSEIISNVLTVHKLCYNLKYE